MLLKRDIVKDSIDVHQIHGTSHRMSFEDIYRYEKKKPEHEKQFTEMIISCLQM